MTRAQATSDELTICTPPRFRWLLRISVGYTILLAGLVGLWFWWDAHSRARFDAKIAELKAAGEPMAVAGFAVEDVPVEVNAEHFLELAAPLYVDSLDATIPAVSYGFCDDIGLCRDLSNLLDAIIELNREPLCLLRHARGLERSSQTPAGPSLAQYRQFARLAAAAANHAHVHLNDAEAVECLRDGMALSRILAERRPPTLINLLVGIAMDGLACRTIGQIASELDVIDQGPPSIAGPARRAQVERLIADLLDESALAGRFRDSIRVERGQNIVWLGLLPGAAPGGVAAGPTPTGWSLIGPSLRYEAREILDHTLGLAAAVSADTFPEAKERMPPFPFDGANANAGGIDAVRTLARRIMLFDMRSVFESYYDQRVTRRMAAAALAIRLYEIDHGRRPAALADLVPHYLAEVPADPFAPQPQAIRYRPGDDACLYSVGANAIDDGGVDQKIRRDEIILRLDFRSDPKLLMEFPDLLQRTPDKP